VHKALPDENAFVMEFVDGPTLQDLIASDLDTVRANFLPMALGLSEALSAAHRQQILHRDIKPANILMAAPDTPKLADFGVARILGESGVAFTYMGTPVYMAPEIHRGDPYDAAADIYSLGTLFYEIWAGRRPFRAPTLAGLMLAKLQGDHEPAHVVNPACPEWLSALIDRMIATDPPRPSAEQVRVELLTQQWMQQGSQLASIDDYALFVGSIYAEKNSQRGPLILLAHFLAELEGVVGGLREIDSDYGRKRALESLPKAFAWLVALVTGLNFRLSQVIDLKFPGNCPYCDSVPCRCEPSASTLERNRAVRNKICNRHAAMPPASDRAFREYQDMFRAIYHDANLQAGAQAVCLNSLAAVAQFADAFLRLRSLKELNAIEIIPVELADNVAWFMALVNLVAEREADYDFNDEFRRMYPGTCPNCASRPCRCPDVDHELRLINWRDFK
jgi:hypothetical protein